MTYDPFLVLGCPSNSSERDLREARRRLLADLHPDRLPQNLPPEAARAIEIRRNEVNRAFELAVQIISNRSRTSDNHSNDKIVKRGTSEPTTTTNWGCLFLFLVLVVLPFNPPLGLAFILLCWWALQSEKK